MAVMVCNRCGAYWRRGETLILDVGHARHVVCRACLWRFMRDCLRGRVPGVSYAYVMRKARRELGVTQAEAVFEIQADRNRECLEGEM